MDKKILNNIIDAKTRYENSIQSGFGKDAKKREYMNTLFNHANALIAAAQAEADIGAAYEAKLKEKDAVIDSLMAALEKKSVEEKNSLAGGQPAEEGTHVKKRGGAKSQA